MERQGLTIASSVLGEGALQCGEDMERRGLEWKGLDWRGKERNG